VAFRRVREVSRRERVPQDEIKDGAVDNGADHWRSRDGFKLAYDSQRESEVDRLHRRLKRLFGKIAMTYDRYESCWPTKPQRMRQTTYAKIEAAILQAEDQINAAIEARLGGFLRWYGALGGNGPL
jgi:hypothetical protein